jgi:hypothetical protein
MFDYRDFQQVFPAGAQLPYGREFQAEIDYSRKTFDGLLFIDRVMQALGLPSSMRLTSSPPTVMRMQDVVY